METNSIHILVQVVYKLVILNIDYKISGYLIYKSLLFQFSVVVVFV